MLYLKTQINELVRREEAFLKLMALTRDFELEDKFYGWLGTTTLDFDDGITLCVENAVMGYSMPWEIKGTGSGASLWHKVFGGIASMLVMALGKYDK